MKNKVSIGVIVSLLLFGASIFFFVNRMSMLALMFFCAASLWTVLTTQT